MAFDAAFSVKTVLKGGLKSEEFTLRHYQLAKPAKRVGGWLVNFDPKQNNEYLMFLKKNEDGSWAAVSGQDHPRQSISRLSR
jgi:hypothetical protein